MPLQGVRVVEVAEGVAGPFCGRMLAAFGADVVKVEQAPSGDRTRSLGPRLPGVKESEASALFLYLNMGKRSVALDWWNPHPPEPAEGPLPEGEGDLRVQDRDLLMRLVESADVLIEDWSAETRAVMGIDAMLADRPGLIDLSLTPFGTDGPYSRWRTTPLVSLALGGFLYLSGDEDREPLMIPGFQSEYLAGLHGYAGAMIALWKRTATGVGGRVEVSEIESLAALHQFTTVMHTYSGLVRSRHGARWENKGAYGRYPITVLPCKDGYVAFAVSTEGQWEMLFPMVGRADLLDEPRFETFVERRKHADEIDAILIDWMKDKTRAEVFEYAAGTWSEPASPLLDLGEVLEDRQLAHRGLFTEVDHPDAGRLTYPTVPFKMSVSQPRFERAPRLGEHGLEEVVERSEEYSVESPSPQPSPSRERGIVEEESSLSGERGIVEREPSSSRGRGIVDGESSVSRERGLLGDVRVLDLTRVWAGPLATRVLGDFGAEVIKISDPRVPLDRTSGTNNKLNRNKVNLALRLDHEEGRAMFLDLVANADVVVENFRPRVMRNFGLTYERLREARPDIVMCSMPGFGTTGEYADYPAFGPSVEAMTGLSSMMGYPSSDPRIKYGGFGSPPHSATSGEPRTSSLAFPDLVAGLNSVAAIMTALHHRRRTGEGQFIDLALTEGPICQIGEHIAAYSRTGVQPPMIGNSHPAHAPYGVYPAAGDDNWVAICVQSDAEWRVLCGLMGRPELARDGRFGEEPARRGNRDEVDAIVSEWSRSLDGEWVASTAQSVGISAGRVAKNWQMLEDVHLNARGFFMELVEPDVGRKKYPGQAIIAEGLRKSDWKPSARLGEHSEWIARDVLGMSRRRIEKLESDGTIGIFREES